MVYNAIARKVLRIIKAEKGQNVSAEADRAEIERRLKFEKLVIVSCWNEFYKVIIDGDFL